MVNVATQPGTFNQFASVAEQVNAASSRAEQKACLSQYFSQLRDDHLVHAVRYLTGHAFPLRDRPSAQVSEVLLMAALSILSGAEPSSLTLQRRQLGDFSEVAVQVMPPRAQALLTLDDVAIALEQLSKAKGKRKLGWVIKLLERATPLEAKYLIQLLSGFRKQPAEAVIEAAVAHCSRQPIERIQWVHTLLGDLGKTAVLARHNCLDQARLQLFQPLKFMLASVASDPTEVIEHLPQGFAVETKYDGIRVQAHIAPADRSLNWLQETVCAGIRVALFSRTLEEVTGRFPDLILPLAALEPHALVSGETAGLILDGEIVPARDGEILPFSVLQDRLGNYPPSEELIAQVPVAFIAYDVLYKDGTILINQPYQQRRQVLEALPLELPQVRLADAQPLFDLHSLEQQYLQARSRGQEGLMVKALHSPYRPGRRSKDWLKMRRMIRTLDVVVTGFEVQAQRSADSASPAPNLTADPISAYILAVRTSETNATLLNIGKATMSLSTSEQQALSDGLRQQIIQEVADGRIAFVVPKIVIEVAFDYIRESPRHKSGYVLELARIVRIRTDKATDQIDTLDMLAHLAKLQVEATWDSGM